MAWHALTDAILGAAALGDIGVGMPGKFLIMRDLHSAEHNAVAWLKRVNIVSGSKTWGERGRHQQSL
ncbi:MAG: hypothetical protein AAGL11_03495 [Pseudomonadota bacterium]